MYKVYFRSDFTGLDHEGILVLLDPSSQKKKGPLFHVDNASTYLDDASGRVRLRFHERENYSLDDSKSCRRWELMGTIQKAQLGKLRAICSAMPDVVRHARITFPNCATWTNNVIYELKTQDVVSFHKDFPVPKYKRKLQAA